MISFNKFIEHKLMLEQDAPGGPPAGGPPAGGPPGGGGGPPPMPMPPSGGPPGGGGGPAPGGAGGQTAPKKLKAVNFWDVLEDELVQIQKKKNKEKKNQQNQNNQNNLLQPQLLKLKVYQHLLKCLNQEQEACLLQANLVLKHLHQQAEKDEK